MQIGTRSVLFGVHAFWLHPFFVAWGWTRLYGFPFKPWLWVAFFVHDLGYIGKPNLDGPEGENHPWTGARILWWLQGAWLFLEQPVFLHVPFHRITPMRWWNIGRRWNYAHLGVDKMRFSWGNQCLYHSRFLARVYGAEPSQLCWADKMAFVLTPRWLYLPMARFTGEIREYQNVDKHQKDSGWYYQGASLAYDEKWHKNLVKHITKIVEERREATN